MTLEVAMFDPTRLRPTLAERLGFFVVVLVAVLSLVAPALAILDSGREPSRASDVAARDRGAERIDVSTAERCPCPADLVLRVPAKPAEVPSSGPL